MYDDILLESESCDILIRDGKVFGKGKDFKLRPGTKIIDTRGYLLTKGFTDLHVHLREPGFSYKETILTGSKAAAKGGFTTVCTMPNLNPPPDSIENLEKQLEIIRRDAVIDVLPYCTITKERKGLELVDFAALKGACVAFSDDGNGVQGDELMEKAFEAAAANDCIIASHCEDNKLADGGYIHKGEYCKAHGHRGICSESEWKQIERDIALSEKSGCRYHVCHISTAKGVELVREAKNRGVRVTCETAPHYLLLCDEDLREDGRFKMNPPLRSREDREALLEGIVDGTIDAIATDHAPHTAEEKSKGLKGSAMGITGLETAFPVLYTGLVLKGKLSLERLLELMSTSPMKIFDLDKNSEDAADFTLIDLNSSYTIDSRNFLSMGHSTPFEGMEVRGSVIMTIKNGRIVWDSLK